MRLTAFIIVILCTGCKDPVSSNEETAARLKEIKKLNAIPENAFSSDTRMAYYDSLYKATKDSQKSLKVQMQLIRACLENGDENMAIGYG